MKNTKNILMGNGGSELLGDKSVMEVVWIRICRIGGL